MEKCRIVGAALKRLDGDMYVISQSLEPTSALLEVEHLCVGPAPVVVTYGAPQLVEQSCTCITEERHVLVLKFTT